MASEQEEALLQFFQAVGQPERLKMLGMMANKPYSVAELANELGLKETAVSHHLRRLQKMGLVVEDSRQFAYTYQLDSTALKQLEQFVIDGKSSNYFEQMVLKRYIKADRIQRIPTDKKEREVIIRWLADQFKIGKRYSETEVEAIILQHYPSHKMLKRYLRDRRYLKTTQNIYWRPRQEV